MLCDICGKKKATVHLTEIVDEQISELHLCEDCAREKSIQMEQQFGLADLLAGLTDFGKQTADKEKTKLLKCPNCQLSYDDFRKLGRLGCSECYRSFYSQLGVLLKKIHGANRHVGKRPLQVPVSSKVPATNIGELKEQLQLAIQTENFEEAAKLRDKIRELEQRGDQ